DQLVERGPHGQLFDARLVVERQRVVHVEADHLDLVEPQVAVDVDAGGTRDHLARAGHWKILSRRHHARRPVESDAGDIGRHWAVKIALGQINPTIGDFEGNRKLVLEAVAAAEARGAELALFPELALSGYPPKDLLERTSFVEAARASLDA